MYRSKTDGSMRAYRRVTIEGKAVEQPTFGDNGKSRCTGIEKEKGKGDIKPDQAIGQLAARVGKIEKEQMIEM